MLTRDIACGREPARNTSLVLGCRLIWLQKYKPLRDCLRVPWIPVEAED